ncbi:MAG TPA: protein kinase, partial [Thermoanaerobaculia bacterium]|nr:protein kinase [Thermoanaerobaculia bacterium]
MLLPGTRLGPYTIVGLLGIGGMGEVYRAEDSRLGREVAIKVLPPNGGDALAIERFRKEARAVAALSHPNIVAIFDFGAEQDVLYAVTELLEGETLRARLSRGPIPPRDALAILLDVADGVAAAHARGFIHRDLKPENIFLTTSGRVKVLDFGLVRSTGTFAAGAATEPGLVVGTLGYLAPEQLEGKPLSAATDVFALGCVLYESIARALPFEGPSSAHIVASVLRDSPPHLKGDDAILGEIDVVVQRCLDKDPLQRPKNAGELATEIRRVLAGERTTMRHFTPRVRGAPAIAVTAIVALIVLAGLVMHAMSARQIDQGYDLRLSDVRGDADTRRLVAFALRADAEGNRPKATQLLEEAQRRSPRTAIPAAFLSSWGTAAGNFDVASRWRAEAVRRLDGASTYESLLVRYLSSINTNEAKELALANSILDVRPDAWRLRLGAAHIHLARRNREAALRELKQIDVAKPDDRRLMLVLADRASLGDVAGADRDLHASRLMRHAPFLHYTEGRIAWSRGDVPRAQRLFEQAAEESAAQNIATLEAESRVLSGLALVRMNKLAEAQQTLTKAAARAKDIDLTYRAFDATAISAYAAARAGDPAARDRWLEEAHALATHPGYSAGIRVLAIRLGSNVWQRWTIHPAIATEPDLTGVMPLIVAREKWAAGDLDGARQYLRWSRTEGVDTTG